MCPSCVFCWRFVSKIVLFCKFGTENVSICPLFAHFCKTRKPLVSLGLRHFLPTFPLFFYTIMIKKLIYIKSLSKKSGHVSTRGFEYANLAWTIMKGCVIMNENESIKMIYPDGHTTSEITIECMENVLRRAKIGQVVEVLAIPVGITVVGMLIWKKSKR